MTRPMRSREAIEAASAWLRRGRTPPRPEAERIANALDVMAIGMALGRVHVRRARRGERSVANLSENLAEA